MNELDRLLGKYSDTIEQALDGFVTPIAIPYAIVLEAMRYSLLSGGKRIRPVLTLEFAHLCGGDVYDALPFACAVEMIHTYSLIHDDLPRMDDDDLRRGRPTCHKAFGEAIALLAGDALLTNAFTVMTEPTHYKQYNAERVVRAVSRLSRAAGTDGMIGGQVIDILVSGKPMEENALYRLHNLKTGALLEAACTLGVISAGGDEEKLKAASDFGKKLGLAFQIYDDILDVEGNVELLGKTTGSDGRNEKTTFVTLYGIDRAKAIGRELTNQAIATVRETFHDCDFIRELAMQLSQRKR